MNDPHPWFRRLGVTLQGLTLGGLLILAILKLLQVASQDSVFRYEGF